MDMYTLPCRSNHGPLYEIDPCVTVPHRPQTSFNPGQCVRCGCHDTGLICEITADQLSSLVWAELALTGHLWKGGYVDIVSPHPPPLTGRPSGPFAQCYGQHWLQDVHLFTRCLRICRRRFQQASNSNILLCGPLGRTQVCSIMYAMGAAEQLKPEGRNLSWARLLLWSSYTEHAPICCMERQHLPTWVPDRIFLAISTPLSAIPQKISESRACSRGTLTAAQLVVQ